MAAAAPRRACLGRSLSRSLGLGLAASLALAMAPLPVAAVLLAEGDGSRNTRAPEDDFGFANVGARSETAIYLGRGWVITANHVPTGEIELAGATRVPVPGSRIRLRNPTHGLSADVALFRLQEPWPRLPDLPIREQPPELGGLLVLVGNGPDRGDPVEVDGRRGWLWGGAHSLRWGTNRVHARDFEMTVTGHRSMAFSMRLDEDDATRDESSVGVGDSGGGAFAKNGDRWELAGILIALQTFDGQPARTSVFGNLSLAADLSFYRDQILAAMSLPACRNGLDDDGDGRIDHPNDTGCDGPDDTHERSESRGLGPGFAVVTLLAFLGLAILAPLLLWPVLWPFLSQRAAALLRRTRPS